uniref:Uncharacterized protein n=1 Tax=Cacopsylla melanoneura TaxID=428564 RepID=A0A8D8XZU0_9HEMI
MFAHQDNIVSSTITTSLLIVVPAVTLACIESYLGGQGLGKIFIGPQVTACSEIKSTARLNILPPVGIKVRMSTGLKKSQISSARVNDVYEFGICRIKTSVGVGTKKREGWIQACYSSNLIMRDILARNTAHMRSQTVPHQVELVPIIPRGTHYSCQHGCYLLSNVFDTEPGYWVDQVRCQFTPVDTDHIVVATVQIGILEDIGKRGVGCIQPSMNHNYCLLVDREIRVQDRIRIIDEQHLFLVPIVSCVKPKVDMLAEFVIG